MLTLLFSVYYIFNSIISISLLTHSLSCWVYWSLQTLNYLLLSLTKKKKGLCILKKTNFFFNLEYSELCSLEANEFLFPSLLGKLLVVNKQELWGYFWARVSKPHKEIFKLICSHDTQPSFSLKIDIWEINKVSFLLVFLFYKHLWKN